MRSLALLLTTLVLPATVGAQPDAPPAIPVIKLIVKPSAAPMPALRYELLPTFREQIRGNAALPYHRAILLATENRGPDWKKSFEADQKIDELAGLPLKDIPLDELRSYLQSWRSVLREVEGGAKRDSCDWDLERRIDADGIGVLLPEVQKMRELARALSLRCRLHIAEGKLDEALADVRTGFAMARHTGKGPTLIQALVGFALFQIFAQRLEQILEMPDCPNLYWALTALPRPFHSMRKPIEGEVRSLEGSLPVLRDLEKGPMSTEQVRAALEHWSLGFQRLSEGSEDAVVHGRLATAAAVALQFPNARQALLRMGKSEAELDAMPAGQVVLLEAVLRFKSVRDEMFVWFHLPYYEAREGVAKASAKADRQVKESLSPFAAQLMMMLPAVEKVHLASVRSERRIMALRVIEALRMHAAANGGKFPTQLADISIVPVPFDPVTGKSFDYELADGKALLSAPPPPGQMANQGNTLKYELTLKK
jgi:hypothetical protein